MAEPVLKSIYDEGEAIEQAYAQGKIGEQLRDSMLQAAVTSAIISTVREVGNFATSETKTDKEGKTIKGSKADSWNEKYFDQMAMRTEYGDAIKELNKLNDKYSKKLGGDIKKYLSGEIESKDINLSNSKYDKAIGEYSYEMDKWVEKYSNTVKKSFDKLPDNKFTEQYKKEYANASDSSPIASQSDVVEGVKNAGNEKFEQLKAYGNEVARKSVNEFDAIRKASENYKGGSADEFWYRFKMSQKFGVPFENLQKSSQPKQLTWNGKTVENKGNSIIVKDDDGNESFGVSFSNETPEFTGIDTTKNLKRQLNLPMITKTMSFFRKPSMERLSLLACLR